MKRLFHKIREDTCPICNRSFSLELYDMYNNPVYYSSLLNSNSFHKLQSKRLSHFQCKRCHTIFPIKWCGNDRTIPKPLTENMWNDFMRGYDKPKQKKIEL